MPNDRIAVSVPNLDILKGARSSRDLDGPGNEELFDFDDLLAELSAHLVRSVGTASPGEWALARRLIDGLEHAARLVNYLLAQQPSIDPQDVHRSGNGCASTKGRTWTSRSASPAASWNNWCRCSSGKNGLPPTGRRSLQASGS